MLPIATDNGARLAAILPTGLAAVARSLGDDAVQTLTEETGRVAPSLDRVPALSAFVLVVVDGLGHANLQEVRAHAPTLARLQRKRIETVVPSTTGAALTSITTGTLPGTHGLIGYRIKHPELGLRTTLKEWEGISDQRSWQRATPLFEVAARIGARPVAFGRPSHAHGGLTEAILTGASYVGGQRIEDRFAEASRLLRSGDPLVAYLYVDELDKAAHASGWRSQAWIKRLEQFDSALADFLRGLPSGTGVVVTADHGIIDVPADHQVLLDQSSLVAEQVAEIGGEPRFRSLYLHDPAQASWVATELTHSEGGRAWVGTRAQWCDAGYFGQVAAGVPERLGDVIVAARKGVAYYSTGDSLEARSLIGQHGSLTEDERGVPIALAGSLDGSGFISALGSGLQNNGSAAVTG